VDAALAVSGWLFGIAGLGVAFIATRSKIAFAEAIACIAHELRAPITAARLGIELARRTAETSAAGLRAIDLELERAALALDDLSAVPHGSTVRRRTEVDLHDLLDCAVEAWRGAADERGRRVVLDCAHEEVSVWGDRLRLAQAVENLIANAIEHGGGEVRVRCRRVHGAVRIEVSDDGPGLRAPVRELAQSARRGGALRILDRRRRSGLHRGGRGRGVAIALAVIAEHGGRLAAGPAERGARLVVELPACDRSRAGASRRPS